MEPNNKLGATPIRPLLYTMAVPLMLSLLIQSLYNIVDSIFVARLSEAALTAASLVYAIQFLMIAIGVGTAVGLNALLSRRLGQKKPAEACRAATTDLFLMLGTALVFTMVGLLFSDRIAGAPTREPEMKELCREYLSVNLVFCWGIFLQTYGQRLLQAVGDTVLSMISLILGAVVNIILDPITIFGLLGCPAMGIRGAAIATVIGQLIGAAAALGFNRVKNPVIHVRLQGYRFLWQDVKDIYRVGLPTIVRQAWKVLLPTGIIFALCGTAMFLLFPRQLLGLFSASEEMLAFGVPALRIISVTFLFAVVTILCGYFASGLGNGVVNMIGGALRQLLRQPALYIKTMAGTFVPAIAVSLHQSRTNQEACCSLFHPIHLVLAAAAAQLQAGNALHKLGELGIAVIPHVEVLEPGVQLVAQFAQAHAALPGGPHGVGHPVFHLGAGLVVAVQPHQHRVALLHQLQAGNLVQKLGEQAVPVIAHIKVRVFVLQPAADFAKAGGFALVLVLGDDADDVVLHCLFGQHGAALFGAGGLVLLLALGLFGRFGRRFFLVVQQQLQIGKNAAGRPEGPGCFLLAHADHVHAGFP